MINSFTHIQQVAMDESGSPTTKAIFSPIPLRKHGMIIPIVIATSDLKRKDNKTVVIKSRTVLALLDTGCSRTSIDTRLAVELGLKESGQSQLISASGTMPVKNYVADISFPGEKLDPFVNWRISSCVLPYDPNADIRDVSKFGLLIGRDMMSRWNITWNGSNSAVCISE